MALNLDVGVKESALQELERLAAALRSVDASLASLGKGNLTGLDSLNQGLTRMRREAAVGIQGIRNDLAEIAAASANMKGQLRKSGQEVGEAAAAAGEQASKGFDRYTARLMVGSAKIVETQEKAAAREAAAAEKRKAQLMVGSAKIAEAQEQAAAREEAARAKWQARLMVGSAKIAEAQAREEARTLQDAEKRVAAQRRADAMFEQAQEQAAARHAAAVERRLSAQRRADAMFEAAAAKAEAERARASAGVAGVAPSTVVTSGGSVRVPSGPDVPKLKALTAAMNDAHSAARGLASGFNAMFLTWGNLVPLLAGAAVSNAFVQTIKLGADVANTFAIIKNLSEETSTAVAGLNSQMLELARSGPFGPREVAEAMKTLSLAGLNAKEVGSSIKDVLNFAVAGDTSIKTAADVMSSVATAFKISADGYNYVGDVIAKTAAVSKSSIDSIGESFKTASVINSQYGASLEDVGTGLALLSNLGIQGTAAGTALRNMYVDLLGRTPKVEKALKELGVSAIDPLTGKARDMISVFKDLDAALKKFTPESQTKLLGDVFSERGGKGAIAALDALRQRAKEAGVEVSSYLEEIRQKIEDSAGFMAVTAANMALTPLNQMKSVVASFQATMVEAFDGLQPYIVSMSQQLKGVFASEDFKRGLQDLVVGVAEVTKFLVEHAGAIVTVIGAYAALKAAMAIGALMQAGAVMAAAYSASLSGVASAQTAVATASVLAGRGISTLTATMTAAATVGSTVMAGVSGLMTLLSRLSPWILGAVAAWELYSFWTDKSAKSQENYSGSNHAAYIAALDAETKRLNTLAEAKRQNVEMDQMMRIQSGAELDMQGTGKLNEAWKKVQGAQKALNDMSVGGASTNMMAFNASKDRAKANLAEAQARYEELRISVAAEKQLRAQAEERVREAARRVRDEQQAEAKARQDAFQSGNRTVPPAGKGAGAGASVPAVYDRNPFNGSEAVYKADEKALKQYLSTESKLLNARRSEQLINEGEYQAQLLMLTSESEQAQLALLERRATVSSQAYEAEQARIKAEVKDEKVEKRHLEELKQKYDGIVASITAETEAIRLNIKERRELANISSRGELAKLDRQTENYWAKDKTELEAAKKLEDQKERLRYASQEEVAAFEASTAAQAKYAREGIKLRDALDHALESQYAFNQTLMSGTSITPEMEEKARELGVTVEELTKRWREFNATAQERAAEAGMDAAARVMRDKARVMTNELADGIVTGLMRGGKEGGKALRSWLMKYFVQEPLTIMVRGILGSVSGGLLNMVMGGGGGGGGEGGGGGGVGNLLNMASMGRNAYNLYQGGLSGFTAPGSMYYNFATSSMGQGLGLSNAAPIMGNNASAFAPAGTQLTNPFSGAMSNGGSLAGAGAFMAVAAVILNGLGAFRSDRRVNSGLRGTLGSGEITPWEEWREGGTLFSGPSYNTFNPIEALTKERARLQELRDMGADGSRISTQQMIVDNLEEQYGGMAETAKKQSDYIQKTFGAMKDSAMEMGKALGLNTDKLKDFTTQLGGDKGINLEGLNADEAQAKIAEALATANNELAQQIIGTWETTTTETNRIVVENIGSYGEDAQLIYTELTDTITSTRYVASEYAKEGEKAIDTLTRLATSLTTVNSIWDQLGYTLLEASLKGADAASRIADAFGGLEAMTAATGSYFQNFYSEEERRSAQARTLQKELDKYGLKLPDIDSTDARAQYRALVEAQDLSTEEGLKAYAMLVQLSGGFASLTKEAESATQALEEQRDRAYSSLERAVAAEQKRLQDQLSAAQEVADKLKSIFDLLHDNVRSLRGEVDASRATQVEAANTFINKALAEAKTKGTFPDLDKLSEAISDARSGLVVENYGGDVAERDYAALVLAGKLAGMEEIAGQQLTDAQRTVKELQYQTQQLDDMLEYWRQQIEIANGTYEGIVSVEQAIRDLQVLLGGPETKPGGVTTGGGGEGSTDPRQYTPRVDYGAEEALTTFEKFKAWYQGIRNNADPSKMMDGGYKVPDWLRVAGLAADNTDQELFEQYLFYKNNPQYAKDFQQIFDTGRSSFGTDGSTLVKSDISKMPEEVRNYFKGDTAALLAYEGMGMDPVLAYQLYKYGPEQFGISRENTNFTSWLQTHKWTAGGIVENNNVLEFSSRGYGGYSQAKRDPNTGYLLDFDGRMYDNNGKFVGMASRDSLEAAYGQGFVPVGGKSRLYEQQIGSGSTEAEYYGAIRTNLDKAINDGWSAQQIANAIRDTGASLQDVATAYGVSVATIRENLVKGGATSIPAFAEGGYHSGGLRIVGEDSWELEATGPSRIWNQDQLADALVGTRDTSPQDALLREILEELRQLKSAGNSTASDTKRTADVLEAVKQGDGLLVTTPETF